MICSLTSFCKIIANIFAYIKDSLFLCSAKTMMRYETMPPPSGYFCICHIIMKPIGAVIVSGNGNVPVAQHHWP